MNRTFNIVCSLALLCTLAATQETKIDRRSPEYLESLDDVTLLLQSDTRAALEIYKERSAHYTKEEKDAVMRAYHEARAEQRSRDGASTEVLLERMSTSTDPQQRQHASIALQRQYEKADDVERQAMRDAFLAAWRTLPVPQAYDRSGVEEANYLSFSIHLARLFPDEADALPILEERFVESGLHNGLLQMFHTLSRDQFELGPLTAARAEAVFQSELQPGKFRAMDGKTYYFLRDCVLSVLGKCGESGMVVLRQLDLLHTSEGFAALKSMGMEEAEPLLWEMVEDPETYPSAKLDAMYMIHQKAYNYPDPDRKARFREPLSALLKAPTSSESYQLKFLERAVDMTTRLNDSYYYPHVVALETSIDWNILAEAELNAQGGMNPDTFPLQYTVASVRKTIDTAKALLRE